MGFSYLNNKSWEQVTREERVFCFELYETIRKDPKAFLQLILMHELDCFEIGLEVCFYRDVMYEYDLKIGQFDLPKKRTFDMVIFTQNEIVIIEAKANQGFDKVQLESFEKDREYMQELFEKIKINSVPKVTIGAICSSEYQPSVETKKHFDFLCTWNELAEIYPNKKEIFNRANHIYRNKEKAAPIRKRPF